MIEDADSVKETLEEIDGRRVIDIDEDLLDVIVRLCDTDVSWYLDAVIVLERIEEYECIDVIVKDEDEVSESEEETREDLDELEDILSETDSCGDPVEDTVARSVDVILLVRLVVDSEVDVFVIVTEDVSVFDFTRDPEWTGELEEVFDKRLVAESVEDPDEVLVIPEDLVVVVVGLVVLEDVIVAVFVTVIGIDIETFGEILTDVEDDDVLEPFAEAL